MEHRFANNYYKAGSIQFERVALTFPPENKTNMTILGHLMGHTTMLTTQRYIANNSEYHRQMVEELAERFGVIFNASHSWCAKRSSKGSKKVFTRKCAAGTAFQVSFKCQGFIAT